MRKPPRATFPCPNCGAEVRAGSRSCPECGSDEETGWSDDTLYDGLDLPEPDRRGRDDASPPPRRSGLSAARAYRIAAVVLLLMFAAAAIGRLVRIW